MSSSDPSPQSPPSRTEPTPSLRQRIYVPEQMDAPDCDESKLCKSYEQLAIINRALARVRSLLRRYVLRDAVRVAHPVTLIDVGCGGGDVLVWLAGEARRKRMDLRLIGLDPDPRALRFAGRNLQQHPEVQLVQGSLDDLPSLGAADYVFSNHMLHHVPPADVAAVLGKLRRSATRLLLVHDLERCRAAYGLFTVLAGIAFRKSFVYADGRLSIRKGFRRDELEKACTKAGFPPGFRVARWPLWHLAVISPVISTDRSMSPSWIPDGTIL